MYINCRKCKEINKQTIQIKYCWTRKCLFLINDLNNILADFLFPVGWGGGGGHWA